MATENRLEALVALCSQIPGLKFSIRGSGKAQFLFGQTAAKAIELSEYSPGYFIEVWESADESSEDAPVLSQRVDSLPEIELLLRTWMT